MITTQNPMTLQRHDYMFRTNQKFPHITETSEFLIERMKSNLNDALNVLPEHFWHWQMLRDRRCICAQQSHEGGNSSCPFCYGTGFLPGYSKRGFKTEILNYTNSWNGFNITTDLSNNKIYPSFLVKKQGLKAVLETAWIPIGNNLGLDIVKCYSSGDVTLKAWNGKKTYDISNDYETFEKEFNEFTKLKFIVEMRKKLETDNSPVFSGLKLRYKVSPYAEIRADIPKFNFEMERDDSGILDVLDSYNLYVNAEVAEVLQIGDFFEHVRPVSVKDNINRKNLKVKYEPTGYRFRLQRTEVLAPQGNVINSDTLVRLIQKHEPYSLID